MRERLMAGSRMRNRMFDLLAPLYDLGIWFAGLPFGGEDKLRGAVLGEAGPLKGKRVLEIFAGTATLSLMAAKMGAQAVASDISRGMINVAREKARRAGLKTGLTVADAESLPFEEGSFDTVLASIGFHEARSGKVPEIIAEVNRVLKNGGRLVIFDFHKAEGLTGLIQAVFFAFAEGEDARRWVRMDLQDLLAKKGFKNFRRKFMFRRSLQLVTVEKRQGTPPH